MAVLRFETAEIGEALTQVRSTALVPTVKRHAHAIALVGRTMLLPALQPRLKMHLSCRAHAPCRLYEGSFDSQLVTYNVVSGRAS